MLNFKFYKVLLGKFSWIWNNFFDQGPSSFKSNIWLSPTAIIQSHTEFIRKHLNRGFRGLFIYHFCYRKFLPKSSKNAHFDRQDNQEIIFWVLSKIIFQALSYRWNLKLTILPKRKLFLINNFKRRTYLILHES